MTQPTAAEAKMVDKGNNPQIGNQQVAIITIVDNSGGTGTDTLIAVEASYVQATLRDNFATLRDKMEEIQAVLRLHGLIADD